MPFWVGLLVRSLKGGYMHSRSMSDLVWFKKKNSVEISVRSDVKTELASLIVFIFF